MKHYLSAWVLLLLFLSLMLGILGGLSRIGWQEIVIHQSNVGHGAIMAGSFLGSLICFERVAALKLHWFILVPLTSGASLLFFLMGLPDVAYSLLCLASAGLMGLLLYGYHRDQKFYLLIMLAGAFAWLNGNLVMLVHPFYPLAVYWWIGFLLMTITGKRIEMTSREHSGNSVYRWLIAGNIIYLIGILLPYHSYGRIVAVAGLAASAIGFLISDPALKLFNKTGLTGFSAAGRFAGYFWLMCSGGLFLSMASHPMGYDAALHAFFLGFVFSMILAQSPKVLTGILNLGSEPYHPVMYCWLIIMQFSLIMRLTADFMIWPELRKISGMINGAVIVLYFISLMILAHKAQKNFQSIRFN